MHRPQASTFAGRYYGIYEQETKCTSRVDGQMIKTSLRLQQRRPTDAGSLHRRFR